MRKGTDVTLTGVSEITMGNNDLSSRTEQQAASQEQTAASVEQITATVKQNADNSHQAARLALNAAAAKDINALIVDSSTRVDDGSRLATQAEESMQAMVVSVKQVRDIMDEISSASEEQSHGISQVGLAVFRLALHPGSAALLPKTAASV